MIEGTDDTELVAFEPMTYAEVCEAFADLEDGFWALRALRLVEAQMQSRDDETGADAVGKGIDALIRCMANRAAVGRRFATIDDALPVPNGKAVA